MACSSLSAKSIPLPPPHGTDNSTFEAAILSVVLRPHRELGPHKTQRVAPVGQNESLSHRGHNERCLFRCHRRPKESERNRVSPHVEPLGSTSILDSFQVRLEERIKRAGSRVSIPSTVAHFADDLCWARPQTQLVSADPDYLTGYPRACIRGKENNQRRNVVGCPDTVLTHLHGNRFATLRCLCRIDQAWNGRCHPGEGERYHRVYGDLISSELHRPGPCHGHDAGLGGRIVGLTKASLLAGRRADEYEPSTVSLHSKTSDGRSTARECPAKMGFYNEIEIFVGHVLERSVTKYSSVRAHDIEPTEILNSMIDQLIRSLRRTNSHDGQRRSTASVHDVAGSLRGKL